MAAIGTLMIYHKYDTRVHCIPSIVWGQQTALRIVFLLNN